MMRVPFTLAGALLLAGSLSAYAQTERLPRDQDGGASKQAPAQSGGAQEKPRANSQEQPRVNEGQGAGKEAGQRAQGQDEPKEKSGDRTQGAQTEGKDRRDADRSQGDQADNKDKRDGDKSAGDAGKQQGRDQAGGDNAKGQKHAGKKLEAKQRTVVKETIVKRNVRPVKVNFSINVGAVVPRTVVLYDLPPVLIEYEPGYSRYKFILADDDTILVIDPETWTIVDIIEV